jgi:hypothetical protein
VPGLTAAAAFAGTGRRWGGGGGRAPGAGAFKACHHARHVSTQCSCGDGGGESVIGVLNYVTVITINTNGLDDVVNDEPDVGAVVVRGGG